MTRNSHFPRPAETDPYVSEENTEGGNVATKLRVKRIHNWGRRVVLILFGLVVFDFVLFGLVWTHIWVMERKEGGNTPKTLSLSASTTVLTKLLNGWTDHLSAVFSSLQMNEWRIFFRVLSITFCAQQLVLLSNLLLANIFSCDRFKTPTFLTAKQ